ncbi:MAG TPA: sugar ABC transporter substrate-binding protein [Acetobacteraceae bacterium]|jgi:ABC-type glycerol-3-phosphate transport system substrate-binding protein|nr:sugar ABC transporter substrate-binding protein [Acetobacteraceae bacterium]
MTARPNRAWRGLLGLTIAAALLAVPLSASAYTFKYPSWMWEEGDVGVWHKKRLAEFEAAHPGIKVQATLIPSSSFEQTINTQIAAGDVPDLLPVFTNMLAPLIDAGALAPFDDCIAKSSLKDRMLSSVSYARVNGKTYGVPLTMSPQSMLVNKALLAQAGVDVPKTLDEMYAAAKAVKEKTGQWGYAFPNNVSSVLFTYIQSMQWVIGLGSDWATPDRKITADAPKTVEAIRWVKRYLDDGLSPRGLDANAVRTLFASGKVAILFDGPWVMTQVQSSNPTLLKDIDFTLMPTPTHAAVTGGAYYTIPAASPHKDDACAYIDLVNGEKVQREWLEGLLQIPGTTVQPSPDFLKTHAWVGTMAEIAAKYPSGLGYAPPGFAVQAPEFRQIVTDHLAQIYSGRATVEAGLGDTQKALERWAAQQ